MEVNVVEASYTTRTDCVDRGTPGDITCFGGHMICITAMPPCAVLDLTVKVTGRNLKGDFDEISTHVAGCLYYEAEVERWPAMSKREIFRSLHRAVGRLKHEIQGDTALFSVVFDDMSTHADVVPDPYTPGSSARPKPEKPPQKPASGVGPTGLAALLSGFRPRTERPIWFDIAKVNEGAYNMAQCGVDIPGAYFARDGMGSAREAADSVLPSYIPAATRKRIVDLFARGPSKTHYTLCVTQQEIRVYQWGSDGRDTRYLPRKVQGWGIEPQVISVVSGDAEAKAPTEP